MKQNCSISQCGIRRLIKRWQKSQVIHKTKKKKEKKKGPVDFSVQCNTTTTNILSSLAQITNLATVTQQQKQHINMYRIQQRIKVVKVFSLYKIISRKYKNHLHHHKTKIYIYNKKKGGKKNKKKIAKKNMELVCFPSKLSIMVMDVFCEDPKGTRS